MYNTYDGYDSVFGATFFIILAIALIIGIGINVLYLLTLHRTLDQVNPDVRKMPPGQVWLLFIPLFNLVWMFIVAARISDSLALEYRRRGIQTDSDRPGYSLGLTLAILQVCNIIPGLNYLASIPFLVIWIIYWVKMAGFKNQLKQSGHWQMFAHINPHAQAYSSAQSWGQQQNWQNPQPNWNQPQQNPNPWQNPQQQNWNQPPAQPQQNWNQPPATPPQQNWNQPPATPPQQNWNQPPATPPQQNWTPPANPQNPPPPPPPGGNTGGIDLNKRD